MSKIHHLKTVNSHFKDVWFGNKTFELTKNDRDFKVCDHLNLMEYDADNKTFSGRSVICEIVHILENYKGIESGYCILSIYKVSEHE